MCVCVCLCVLLRATLYNKAATAGQQSEGELMGGDEAVVPGRGTRGHLPEVHSVLQMARLGPRRYCYSWLISLNEIFVPFSSNPPMLLLGKGPEVIQPLTELSSPPPPIRESNKEGFVLL